MPTTIAANSILQVKATYVLDQQECQNIFHFMNNAETTLESIEDEANNNLFDDYFNLISNEVSIISHSVQSLWPVLTDPYEEGKSYTGGQAREALPVANAVIISMKTGLGGRTHRGRKYIAGIPSDDVNNSRIEEATRTGWQTTWDTINARYMSGGSGIMRWGVLHRVGASGVPVEITDENFTPFTNVIVRSVLGTMRSRLPGHGR